MRKLILAVAVLALFTGCAKNKNVERKWNTAKVAHSVAKAVGGAAIKAGVVSESTADKLRTVNTTIETSGGLAEDIYHVSTNEGFDVNSTDSNSTQ